MLERNFWVNVELRKAGHAPGHKPVVVVFAFVFVYLVSACVYLYLHVSICICICICCRSCSSSSSSCYRCRCVCRCRCRCGCCCRRAVKVFLVRGFRAYAQAFTLYWCSWRLGVEAQECPLSSTMTCSVCWSWACCTKTSP